MRVLASKCDGMVFVGMMALQIMHAMGMSVPLFLVEREGTKEALEIVKYAEYRSMPILLPSDFLCRNNRLHMKVQTFPAQRILDGKFFPFFILSLIFYMCRLGKNVGALEMLF